VDTDVHGILLFSHQQEATYPAYKRAQLS